MVTPAPAPPAIELRGISKAFGPVQANRDISLVVPSGTIHGIVGENGAGKSTLMSILYGFYRPDAGQIMVGGRDAGITDSQSAIRAGIGMVFQHFKLVPNFTVVENVILGAEDGALLAPSVTRARKELRRLAAEYQLNVNPDAVVETLSVGHQQRVEILKALYRQADILILDEPTGVLTPAEADHLFRILKGLRDRGKTVILITHKLREIMEITDNTSVMRRGEMVATVPTRETSPEALAELMVGRKVLLRVDKAPAAPGAPVLELGGLRMVDRAGVERLRGIDLTVRAGEILGIAGVSGNGQTQLLDILGGYPEAGAQVTGTARVAGRPLALSGTDARARRQLGIANIPEDRQAEGLVMEFSAWENTVLGHHREGGALMDNVAIRSKAAAKMERFDVRPRDPDLPARNFSGGNQQKIVVAREIESRPILLLVGQPTRGVDIGAIEFIHRRLIELRDAGAAILLVSVELDEIMALSDRIAVMFDGRIMGERLPDRTSAAELGLLMAGASPSGIPPETGQPGVPDVPEPGPTKGMI
ncbi:ABC transporter ATP-binding protein [Paracoccus sp. MC1862]|uniref:ABC transporter ATP-binding protein n=1 Tax=Paracoccus sp. MC1862 TaxID=2760307 RepID=UPI0015FF9B89|nr:ABC transporter ATP-binding protein [Paracoccus sp. MC1862]MBB1497569.1 ABC transporter ATP-binding protein [Paracoccus sp. MC1862]QQO44018.1 ABC transporter ATP-binding protein [Paracoccus sp. MC1862]